KARRSVRDGSLEREAHDIDSFGAFAHFIENRDSELLVHTVPALQQTQRSEREFVALHESAQRRTLRSAEAIRKSRSVVSVDHRPGTRDSFALDLLARGTGMDELKPFIFEPEIKVA